MPFKLFICQSWKQKWPSCFLLKYFLILVHYDQRVIFVFVILCFIKVTHTFNLLHDLILWMCCRHLRQLCRVLCSIYIHKIYPVDYVVRPLSLHLFFSSTWSVLYWGDVFKLAVIIVFLSVSHHISYSKCIVKVTYVLFLCLNIHIFYIFIRTCGF